MDARAPCSCGGGLVHLSREIAPGAQGHQEPSQGCKRHWQAKEPGTPDNIGRILCSRPIAIVRGRQARNSQTLSFLPSRKMRGCKGALWNAPPPP